MRRFEQIQDWYPRVFETFDDPHTSNATVREVTFQLTEACNLACTYCYQIAKTPRVMSWEVAKRIVDLLFEMSEAEPGSIKGPIDSSTPWIVLDFIGGEPLLQTKLMSNICHYFVQTAISKHHRWATNFGISISSNGTLYFDPDFQQFIEDFNPHLSFSVSIDGDKEAHDACRIYPDGRGSFEDAKKAEQHYNRNHQQSLGTKATIARANLPYIDRIIKYFANEGFININANTVYEEDWNIDDAKLYYKKLKEIADFNLNLENPITISLFHESFFRPKNPDETSTWCGGYTSMLAFDPEGFAYPCIRYMPTSLGNKVPPIIIGDCWNGLYYSQQQLDLLDEISRINWKTQNSEMCLKCPVAQGCADCAAESYQRAGKLGIRNTSSCLMHKARSLANVYYWNKLYIKTNQNKVFKMHLSEKDALEIIDNNEYLMLKQLEERL